MFHQIKSELEFGVIHITPEDAKDILEKRRKNRNTSKANIDRIVKEITDGKWRLNGETIVFDKEFRLVDGQNRLRACVESGLPIVTCAVFGVDYENSFHTIDCGRSRTGGDVLDICGIESGRNTAAAIRWIYQYELDLINPSQKNNSGSAVIDKQTLIEYANRHAGVREWVRGGKKSGLVMPSMRAALSYLFSQKDQAAANEFFNLSEAEPSGPAMRLLRTRLIKNAVQRGASITHSYAFALSVKAWNSDRLGQDIGTLRLVEGERVQRII